ncbi:MAG: DUF362 domain-containing protein [Candidatus Marinimicrobia bacterium]|nr:DUF362 domain-containing protein [Candidatus Neomarinimicrobiota bacterium]
MAASAGQHTVSVRRVKKYDHYEDLLKAVSEIYTTAGGPDPGGKSILLKPNILADLPPERAVTTHPACFRAVAQYFQQRGAKVYAGDSPAIHNTSFRAEKCGIRGVCRELDIEWVDFYVDPVQRNGFKLANIIDKVDYVVSLAKCKTHELTYFTGAVKNCFGLIPGFTKAMLHARYPNRNLFSDMVLDLLETVKPAFSFMDAVIAMEGAGPQNGKPKHVGLILGSANPVALDISMARIIGYDPMKIPMFRSAVERGIYLENMEDIVIEGGDLRDLRVKHFKRVSIDRGYNLIYMGIRSEQLRRRFDRRPVFDHDRCILCGKCVQICKAGALSIKEGKVHIYDPNCIRCYCCQEVCPSNAIEIKRKVFG